VIEAKDDQSVPTDGVLADDQREAMRAYMAAIAASANDAIVGKDLDGTIISWNDAAERLFGYAAADIVGQPITRLMPTERLHEETAILDKMRSGEALTHYETERVTRSGRLIPVALTISPIRDAAGELIGVSKIIRDLTDSQRIARELQRREALLQSILDTVPDALVVIDRQGTIQSFSPAAQRMFGYGALEAVGRSVNMLMPPKDAAAHDRYMDHYLETGQKKIIGIGRVVLGQRKNGTHFPLELQVGEVLVPGSHLFTGFLHDLTERQDRDRRLNELQAELIHISRLSELGQMVSALSHEVNQPLTAIANYAAGLRRLLAHQDAPAVRSAVEKVAEQADRARRILQSLRSLVRKEARERQLERLDGLVQETSALALIGTSRSVDFDMHIHPDAAQAYIDRVQIQQVLLNLMRNAVEAMADSPVRKISVTTRGDGDRVEISVADTGPGLASNVLERLFHPFTTTKADGLGIGLSICRTIVEAHGGELTCENRQGERGTVFRFTLPRQAPTQEAGAHGLVDDGHPEDGATRTRGQAGAPAA
jgi:two-component system sensor kinase FixL